MCVFVCVCVCVCAFVCVFVCAAESSAIILFANEFVEIYI